jgi:hypothetical protein
VRQVRTPTGDQGIVNTDYPKRASSRTRARRTELANEADPLRIRHTVSHPESPHGVPTKRLKGFEPSTFCMAGLPRPHP